MVEITDSYLRHNRQSQAYRRVVWKTPHCIDYSQAKISQDLDSARQEFLFGWFVFIQYRYLRC